MLFVSTCNAVIFLALKLFLLTFLMPDEIYENVTLQICGDNNVYIHCVVFSHVVNFFMQKTGRQHDERKNIYIKAGI